MWQGAAPRHVVPSPVRLRLLIYANAPTSHRSLYCFLVALLVCVLVASHPPLVFKLTNPPSFVVVLAPADFCRVPLASAVRAAARAFDVRGGRSGVGQKFFIAVRHGHIQLHPDCGFSSLDLDIPTLSFRTGAASCESTTA